MYIQLQAFNQHLSPVPAGFVMCLESTNVETSFKSWLITRPLIKRIVNSLRK